jgi:hypothetical protein
MTNVTLHANQRVQERMSLTTAEVCRILNSNRYIPLQHERTKEYLLFHSCLDDCCYVAVRTFNGVLLTVLPIDFYEKRRGPIDLSLQQKVANL